jgi:hypothetical protein
MQELARRGGMKSGETRRLKRAQRIVASVAREKGIPMTPDLAGLPLDAASTKRANRAGGSHHKDWRCPHCRHFNSIKSRQCSKCEGVSPLNGRLTRAALRERMEEHRTAAILGRHGLRD